MVKGNGKRYDEELKKETVKYLLENNQTVAQVSIETQVNINTLHNWIKKYGQQPEVKAAQRFTSPEEENEILKKAMHFFAKSPR